VEQARAVPDPADTCTPKLAGSIGDFAADAAALQES
jgi:hypothetical protein